MGEVIIIVHGQRFIIPQYNVDKLLNILSSLSVQSVEPLKEINNRTDGKRLIIE